MAPCSCGISPIRPNLAHTASPLTGHAGPVFSWRSPLTGPPWPPMGAMVMAPCSCGTSSVSMIFWITPRSVPVPSPVAVSIMVTQFGHFGAARAQVAQVVDGAVGT